MQERGEIKSVKVYPLDRIADAMTDLAVGHLTRGEEGLPYARLAKKGEIYH